MNRTLVSCGMITSSQIYVWFPGEEREEGKEKLLVEIMAKTFPNMINLQTHKSRNSMDSKHKKHKENYNKACQNQVAQKTMIKEKT